MIKVKCGLIQDLIDRFKKRHEPKPDKKSEAKAWDGPPLDKMQSYYHKK